MNKLNTYLAFAGAFSTSPAGNMADWNRIKVPIKKDKVTTARRKANKLARKQRKNKGRGKR